MSGFFCLYKNENVVKYIYDIKYAGNSIKKNASSSYITSQKILEPLKL